MEPTTSKNRKAEVEPTTGKATKAAKAAKTEKPVKVSSPKQPRPKREQIPASDVCVFAFRLSTTDRDRIHQSAGSGKASSFVLAAALAAASGDLDAFKTVVANRATK